MINLNIMQSHATKIVFALVKIMYVNYYVELSWVH
jgi:hypothetical protein